MTRITVRGHEDLHKRMVDATGRLERSVARVAQRAGTRIRRKQRERMREDTGEMKKAVKVRTKRTRDGVKVTVGPRIRQGYYNEYGTEDLPALPAVRDSLQHEEHLVVKELMDVVKQAIR